MPVQVSPASRVIVSLCGPSGSGKSQLAKAIVERLGPTESVRIPTDYYIEPAVVPLTDYFRQPLRYDWRLLDTVLALPDGSTATTPHLDFGSFQRIPAPGGKEFTMRRVVILDGIYPYPCSDLAILVTASPDVRKARIATRDKAWGTQVIDRWEHLELARAQLEQQAAAFHQLLSGTAPLAENAVSVVCLLQKVHPKPTEPPST